MKTYKYYTPQRPPMPGSIPNNGIIELHANDRRETTNGSPCDVWGYVIYDHELTANEVASYELIPDDNTLQGIDYNRLLSQFRKEYTFLYDNNDHVAGFCEAMDFFDNYIKTEAGLAVVSQFNKLRQDIITSDREAAAFSFALDSLNYI